MTLLVLVLGVWVLVIVDWSHQYNLMNPVPISKNLICRINPWTPTNWLIHRQSNRNRVPVIDMDEWRRTQTWLCNCGRCLTYFIISSFLLSLCPQSQVLQFSTAIDKKALIRYLDPQLLQLRCPCTIVVYVPEECGRWSLVFSEAVVVASVRPQGGPC